MMTPREKRAILVLLIIGAAFLLWLFSEPFRKSKGDMVVMQVRQFHAHDDPIVAMALSPDGKFLATAAKDNTIKVWQLPDGKLLHTIQGHARTVTDLAFSHDGQRLVSASADMTVRLWSVATGKLERQWDSRTPDWHTGWVEAVAVSPDGKFLATGSRDTTVKLWDLTTKTTKALPRTLWGHSDTVTALAFSPADKNLLASGSTDGSIWIWDVRKGEPVIKHSAYQDPQQIAFSPKGQWLVVGTYGGKGVKVMDWRKGQQVAWAHEGMEGNVWALSVSPDEHYLVAGAGDNGVWIYDLLHVDQEHKTAKRLHTLKDEYWGDVRGVAFLPDGRTIVAAMEDGNVRMWRLTGLTIHIPTPQLPSPTVGHEHRH